MIPDAAMHGTADQLFDFIADQVAALVEQVGEAGAGAGALHDSSALGFTFSFPTEQTALDAGSLIRWTKGFATSGVEGKDAVALLRAALERRRRKGGGGGKDAGAGAAPSYPAVAALVNDTVGTLVARYYQDPRCLVGVILGTGTNAAYVERLADIEKLHASKGADGASVPDGDMVVNIEWGAFGDTCPSVLPATPMDDAIDAGSLNPGMQRFEKPVERFCGALFFQIERAAFAHS